MTILQQFGPTYRDDGQAFYAHKWLNRLPDTTCLRVPVTVPPDQWPEHDALLFVDFGHDALGLPLAVPPKGKPSLCWLSDTHFSPAAKANRFRWAEAFDIACFVHADGAEEYRAGHREQTVHWLPVAADHEIYHPPTELIEPRWDLCFVGHVGHPRRDEILERVFAAVPSFTWKSGVFFEDCCRVYHQSRIVFNVSLCGDLNMRTFEALWAGALLLTDPQLSMAEVDIVNGENALIYETADEAIKLARWALAHPEERQTICIRNELWRNLTAHTYQDRAKEIRAYLSGMLEYRQSPLGASPMGGFHA